MAEIIVTINQHGATTISVNGVSGPGCMQISAAIERAVGKEIDQEFTSDYYQETQSDEAQVNQ
jgi:predicted ThiF/HesA family dinucleotide-utilizing enzyme